MYWTPCARLMRSITPNTSVSPAAIRNSSTPSCSPLRICTKRRVDIRISHHDPPFVIARESGRSSNHRTFKQNNGRCLLDAPLSRGMTSLLPLTSDIRHLSSLHRAILRVDVLVIGEYLLGDLGLEL